MRTRSVCLLLTLGGLLLAAGTAGASTPATGAVKAVVYGKFSSQIQFVVCFEAADAGVENLRLETDTLAYAYSVRGPDGVPVASGAMPAPGVTYVSVPTCAYSYVAAFDVRDLAPGTTYTIAVEASLTPRAGGSPQLLEDTLVVTTTGGCPTNAPVEAPPAYTYLHALVDADNVVTSVLSIGPATIRQAPWSGLGRWIPTYYGWPGKTYAGIGYGYDPVTDDFHPPGWTSGAGSGDDTCGGPADPPPTEPPPTDSPPSDSPPVDPPPAALAAVTTTSIASVTAAQTFGSVVWTHPAGRAPLRAEFSALPGTDYAIAAAAAGGRRAVRGSCVQAGGRVTCLIRLVGRGRARVLITPTRNGVPGRPLVRLVRA